MSTPFDAANEADVEEQETPVVEDLPDEEASAGSEPGSLRDDVNEADYIEQWESVSGDEDDYPYGDDEE